MQSFNKYITEQTEYKSRCTYMPPEEAFAYIEKYCKQSQVAEDEHKIVLYRGTYIRTGQPHESFFMDPRNSYRRPLDNESGMHNKLIKQIPSWSHVPNREYSVIGSSSYRNARLYGTNIYKVYPIDGTTYVVSTFDDFLGSFPHLSTFINRRLSISAFCEYLKQMFTEVTDFFPELTDTNLIEWCTEIEKKFPEIKDVVQLPEFPLLKRLCYINMPRIIETGFYKNLCDLLDFNKNGFKLTTDISDIKTDGEVWFSNPCILIKNKNENI